MSDLALVLRQVRYENKAFWRNPPAAFFTFAFPLIFLVLFTLLFGSGTTRVGSEVVDVDTYYVAAILGFSIVTSCYTNLAMSLSFTRDEGVLKRVRGTPLPGWAYIAGKILHALWIMVLLVVITIAFGAVVFGAELPTQALGEFVLSVAVGSVAFCALGIATTAIIPNAEAAPAIVNVIILPLLFISGIFIPLAEAPDWLVTVAGIFPVKHLADAVIDSYFLPQAFDMSDVVWMAVWGVVGIVAAIRFFSWEPRR